jgi:shikimate kinase
MPLTRITLVGFRACGKSTIGRLLAARLAWPFVDGDSAVETRLGMSIPAYFKANGEAAFRDREERALAEVLAGEGPMVLATGGGAVLREANRTLLAERGGFVVYLDAPVAVLQERVVDEVPALLAARDPVYRAVAHLIVPVSQGPGEVAARLVDELAARSSG